MRLQYCLFVTILLLLLTTSLGQVYAQNDICDSISPNKLKKLLTSNQAKTQVFGSEATKRFTKSIGKLVRLERKVNTTLQKINPELQSRLFGPDKITFERIQNEWTQKEQLITSYSSTFNERLDSVAVTLGFLQSNPACQSESLKKETNRTKLQLDSCVKLTNRIDHLKKLIAARKSELINALLSESKLGRQLRAVYAESQFISKKLENLKEELSKPTGPETLILSLLSKRKDFQAFFNSNSALSVLFGRSQNQTSNDLIGLQTISSLNEDLQNRLHIPLNQVDELITKKINTAQQVFAQQRSSNYDSSIRKKLKVKPNSQRLKSFKERLETTTIFQLGRPLRRVENQLNIGILVGYRLNDRLTSGLGITYLANYGNIYKLQIKHGGLGVRIYGDYKLGTKKTMSLFGSAEYNQLARSSQIQTINDFGPINRSSLETTNQRLAVIGFSKRIKSRGRLIKSSIIQILFNALYASKNNQSQPFIFRLGYGL